MKAAILESLEAPLSIQTVPDPVLGTGEVIVDVAATRVLAYARDIFNGKRKYLLELPIIPGAGGIGRVRAFGPDATRLAVGDWVFCDPTVRSRDEARAPDIMLQGLTGGDEAGLRLQRYFHDGSFAERMRVPTENVTRIGALDRDAAPAWCGLGTMLVPFGGFIAGNLAAGEIALVNGATGAFGSAGVAVALAMGAAAVLATGRNEAVLEELVRRFGKRVRTVRMRGDEAADLAAILETAPGLIDCVLDILPPAATPAQVRAAVMAVRPGGRVVLMGGVGMGGGGGLELPYPWLMRYGITVRGQWMFPRDAATRLIAMVRAGLVSLEHFAITSFTLDQANEAVTHAAANAGPFSMTVIRP